MVEASTGKHDQAIRLFRFLKELTELRTKTIRTLDNYEIVIWLDKIPRQEGCFCAAWREDTSETSDNWIEVKKPRLIPPPVVPDELKPWLDSKQVSDSSVDYPELREHIIETREIHNEVEGKTEQLITVQLSERPEVKDIWERYVEKLWWPWAEKDRQLKPVQEVYTDLFSIYQKQQRLGEMFEVVLGLGLLIWKTPGGQEVYRHLVTAQVSLDFDAARGIITVGPGSEGAKITLEQDMLEAADRPPVDEQRAIEEQLQEIGELVWDKEPLEAALKSWIHSVSSHGVFQDSISAPTSNPIKNQPQVYYAPALMLRKRNERNLIYVFQEIINQLTQNNELPVGIKSLVDYVVDLEPGNVEDIPVPAVDVYFPLQFNLEQQEIIRRLSSRHGVLVQGPPGTGKSQTIANLVCHLLANGKRVLVTSQAPRALKVLSRMIPKEVTALCVSLLGYDRAALQELEECVFGITEKYNQWNPMENQRSINELEKHLDEARRNEARTLGELKALREEETYIHTLLNGRYHGTLASIAIRLREEEKNYSWIGTITSSDEAPPLSNAEAVELLRLLREINIDRKNEIQQKAVKSSKIIEPADFLAHVHDEKNASLRHKENEIARNHPAYPFLLNAEREWRMSLLESLKELTALYNQLLQHPRPWARQATIDILSGQENRWLDLWRYTEEQLVKIGTLSGKAAESVSGIDNLNRDSLVTDATALLQHLEAGRGLGLGPFQPKVVRNGKYFLRSVYVDGQLCNNKESLLKLLKWLEREKLLTGLYEHWRSFEEVAGPFTFQISTYKDFNSVLSKIISLLERANNLKTTISDIPEINEPTWYDFKNVIAFQEAIVAVSCEEELYKAIEPFRLLEGLLQDISLQGNAHSVIGRLLNVVRQRDVQGYGEAYHVLCSIEKDTIELDKRNNLLNRLGLFLPKLVDSLSSSFEESTWDERLSNFEEAWNWAIASHWLQKKTDSTAFERLTGELSYHQAQIKKIMKQLVEAKAWGHFFVRLEEEQRQHLMAWAAAMRKIGKGTGKYTAQYRKNAREHMEQCRPAIPAWIMPIYRVSESINPRVNAFDVVIVDEASQSGPEGLFLHYLAPKIIVVGDDKQISPEHVGVDREDVNILRERHIRDLPLNDMYSLEDSFFDQAVTRFGGRIRLKEHFRCMPEIIQFSNKICYRSEPLIPLRQRAAGRLSPVKVTHVPDGYRRGNRNRIDNPPEAEAIVEQIIKCCQDPAYTDRADA
ncbi:MAG: AAA domain-containing protein [Bacillota bacterium]